MKPTTILTLGLLAVAMALPVYAAPQAGASWKSNSALLKELQPSAPIAGFVIEHPKGYKLQKGTFNGIYGLRWTSPVRTDGTQGLLIATWLNLPKKEIDRYSLTQYLGQAMNIAHSHMATWSHTAPEMGTINGHAFLRAYWSGKSRGNQVNMRGFLYVTKTGNKIIEIGSQDYVPDEEKYLSLAEAAILTFKTN